MPKSNKLTNTPKRFPCQLIEIIDIHNEHNFNYWKLPKFIATPTHQKKKKPTIKRIVLVALKFTTNVSKQLKIFFLS